MRRALGKVAYTLALAYGLFLVCEHVTLLYKGDASLQTPYYTHMDKGQTPQGKPFVYLISYADGQPIYFKNQMGLSPIRRSIRGLTSLSFGAAPI